MQKAVAHARLEDAWAVCQQVHFPGLARSTRREYRCYVNRALAELPTVAPMISLDALLRWRAAVLTGMHGFDVVYVNQHFAALRTITTKAALSTGDHELATMFRLIRPWPEAVPAPRCPPADFLKRAMLAAVDPAEQAWLMLAGLAGLRYGELLGLMPADYDRKAGVLRVLRQRRSPHRKNHRPHSVRIDATALRWALEWAIDHHQDLGPQEPHRRRLLEPFLFPWSLPHCEKLLQRVKASFGADRDTYLPYGEGWHAFRHWGASELARQGKSPYELQAWLGHSDPVMASRYVDMVRGVTAGSVGALAAAAGIAEVQL